MFEPPPSEQQTTSGVWEAVHRHLGSHAQVSVVGHSFGSCPITWLVHSPYSYKIRQIVLVDPVSILLSEPDVITNFLYARTAMKQRPRHARIGVVSNELFTEHYLRRHFAWYNSELWLEDLPSSGYCKVLVCLSEYDEVLPFEKVRRELDRVSSSWRGNVGGGGSCCANFGRNVAAASAAVPTSATSSPVTPTSAAIPRSSNKHANFDVLVWEGAGHGHCVSRPRTWRQMQSVMKRQEQIILRQRTTHTVGDRRRWQNVRMRGVAAAKDA
uniref:AB hydrolase-1 domain-containing protein n=1 Tax=Craspedostauros australis TaxID=1486917 RepID=A0A7R9ZJM0_9STRA